MMKIFLAFYAIVSFFKFLASAVGCLFKKRPKVKSSATSASRDWYGVCDGCGRKDGLHRFEGKRYCAYCSARLETEKKLGIEIDRNYWEKRNEHIKKD